jgi:hypothetical protein
MCLLRANDVPASHCSLNFARAHTDYTTTAYLCRLALSRAQLVPRCGTAAAAAQAQAQQRCPIAVPALQDELEDSGRGSLLHRMGASSSFIGAVRPHYSYQSELTPDFIQYLKYIIC